MRRITVWTAIAVVLALTAFVIVRAEARGPRGWRGCGWHHRGPASFLAHELKLNDAQRAQIRTLWQVERPAVSADVHDLLAEDRDMNAATVQGNPDPGKVQQIADREAITIAALLMQKERLQAKIYATVLTPEQRAKADALQKEWESRMDRAADRLAGQPAEK
jgi:Spy/CpxP family protein refolding chaperone